MADKVNFQPVGDWCLIEPIPYGETEGGIALPDNVAGPNRGRVVAVGPGRWEMATLIEPEISVGDVVYMYSPYESQQPAAIRLGATTYVLVKSSWLVGKACS